MHVNLHKYFTRQAIIKSLFLHISTNLSFVALISAIAYHIIEMLRKSYRLFCLKLRRCYSLPIWLLPVELEWLRYPGAQSDNAWHATHYRVVSSNWYGRQREQVAIENTGLRLSAAHNVIGLLYSFTKNQTTFTSIFGRLVVQQTAQKFTTNRSSGVWPLVCDIEVYTQWRIQGGGRGAVPLLTGYISKYMKIFAQKCIIFE